MSRKLLSLGLLALGFLSGNAFSQSSIIRGEVSPGVYENLKSNGSQSLNVNITGGGGGGSLTATQTQTTPTVTSTSTTIVAANATRKSIIIQNNDATGNIFLNFGAAATIAHLKLTPGQSFFMFLAVPVTTITAIGSIASNANVVAIEGQ